MLACHSFSHLTVVSLSLWTVFENFKTKPLLFKQMTSDQMQQISSPGLQSTYKSALTHAVNQPHRHNMLYCLNLCIVQWHVLLLGDLLSSALSIAMLSVALVELALVEVQTAHTSRWGPDATEQCSRQQCSKCSRSAVVISNPHSSSMYVLYACTCKHMLTTLDSYAKIAALHLFCTVVAITYLLYSI